MALDLKIATFNVENLFRRPSLLNLFNSDVTAKKLDAFASLQKELRRKTYDKPKIKDLLRQLVRLQANGTDVLPG